MKRTSATSLLLAGTLVGTAATGACGAATGLDFFPEGAPDGSVPVDDAGGPPDASGDDDVTVRDAAVADQETTDVAADRAAPDVAVDAPAEAEAGADAGEDAACTPLNASTRFDRTWIFGRGCRADWDSSNDVTFSTSVFAGGTVEFTGFEGTFTATNAVGGAVFAASDGIALYDGQGVETNVASLGGNASTSQAAAFIGQPGSASDYYVITNAASSGETTTAGLFWTALPCGQPVPAGVPALIPGTELFTEALATIRHANGVDRWVLSVATTGVAVIPVTASGFGAPMISPWGGVIPGVTAMQRAFVVFARDLHTFALTAEGVGLVMGQFDTSSGAVSDMTLLPLPSLDLLYSAAFSPDGTKLYASAWDGDYFQVDLAAVGADGGDATAPVATLGNAAGALRLAVDDRVYLTGEGASEITVLQNPDAPAAQLVITTVPLASGCTSTFGLPGLEDL